MLDDDAAPHTREQVGEPLHGWRGFQPLWDELIAEQPDLLGVKAPTCDATPSGDELPSFVRTPTSPQWNRYAAVNDEFIDVHMSAEAARAAGQPDVFGMGNLRIALRPHAAARLARRPRRHRGVRCQFRALNFRGDALTAHGRVTGTARSATGCTVVDARARRLQPARRETMPATARRSCSFADGRPHDARRAAAGRDPDARARCAPRRGDDRVAGPAARAGRRRTPSAPTTSGAGRRPCTTPTRRRPTLVDRGRRARRGPWGGLVAPRDFNPFAWMQAYRPDVYPWMRGMGTEPGTARPQRRPAQPLLRADPPRRRDHVGPTLVDAYEKEGRLGTMLFLVDESRWTNQRGELVRIGIAHEHLLLRHQTRCVWAG